MLDHVSCCGQLTSPFAYDKGVNIAFFIESIKLFIRKNNLEESDHDRGSEAEFPVLVQSGRAKETAISEL